MDRLLRRLKLILLNNAKHAPTHLRKRALLATATATGQATCKGKQVNASQT